MIYGKLGTGNDDISKVWILVEDKTQPENWDALYIIRNNGEIAIIRKPADMDYAEFKQRVWQSMIDADIVKQDANGNFIGRGQTWGIKPRENSTVDFDELDQLYLNTRYKPVSAVNNNQNANQNTNGKQLPSSPTGYRTAMVTKNEPSKSKKELSEEESFNKLKELRSNLIDGQYRKINKNEETKNKGTTPVEEELNNDNIDDKVINSKIVRKYKIKSVKNIFSPVAAPSFYVATRALAAGALTIGAIAAFASSISPVGLGLGIAACITANNAYKKADQVKMGEVKENAKSYFKERFEYLKSDIMEALNIKNKSLKDRLIDQAIENVESKGK